MVSSWSCPIGRAPSSVWSRASASAMVGVSLVAMSGSFRLVAVSGLVLCGRFGVSPVCDNSSLIYCIIYCNIFNAVFKIISAGNDDNCARWCHRFHWVPPGLFWLNKVLCTIASADWRASNRGINSAAVYAAKVLARREVVATMPAGLIKTKKTKTPAQQSWAGVAPGAEVTFLTRGYLPRELTHQQSNDGQAITMCGNSRSVARKLEHYPPQQKSNAICNASIFSFSWLVSICTCVSMR